jgi:hypothetical protein
MDIEGSSSEDEQQIKSEDAPTIELNIKLVPCPSSVFMQQIEKYPEQSQVESKSGTKLPKFTIVHPDGKSITYIWKRENVLQQLKKLFLEKKYDHETYVLVDNNEIFVDFTKNDYHPPHQPLVEYRIIEKQSLFPIQFRFRTQIYEYLITSKAKILAIIHHFIVDHHLKSLSPDIILCFFDEYGKYIDDEIITDLSKSISIFVTEETSDTNILCEIDLRYGEGNQKKTN